MSEAFSFRISPVPPFRLDLTCWALRRSRENSIDAWDGSSYSRLFTMDNTIAEVTAGQSGPPGKPALKVNVSGPEGILKLKRRIESRIRMMFGTDIDLTGFYKIAAHDSRLKKIAAEFAGLKPPRFASLFEAVVNGICFQQLSLAAGTALLNRVASFGSEHEGRRAFPQPADLAALKTGQLKTLGFSTNKSVALVALSRAITGEGLDLDSLASRPDEEVMETLDAIRGVGPWTAQYVMLRGMGRLSVFPGKDVGASRNLNRYFGFSAPLDFAGVQNFLSRFHPYEGMIYFHLLLKNLTERGVI